MFPPAINQSSGCLLSRQNFRPLSDKKRATYLSSEGPHVLFKHVFALFLQFPGISTRVAFVFSVLPRRVFPRDSHTDKVFPLFPLGSEETHRRSYAGTGGSSCFYGTYFSDCLKDSYIKTYSSFCKAWVMTCR